MPSVTVRLTSELAERLDALAGARSMSRSACVRALIEEAQESGRREDAVELPNTVNEDELHRLLSAKARDGSIPAMRELRHLLRRRRSVSAAPGPGDESSFDELDQVRRRRSKRKGA